MSAPAAPARPEGGSRERRLRLSAAAALVVGLPVAAFFAAPSAHADDSPGANLAGVAATGYATGVQVAPLTPGVVGAGNVSEGNLVEATLPYASASTSTGPTNSCVGAPAYPGDTAAGAGSDIGTFAPGFPSAIAALLNDPVVARADYPAEVGTGSSSSYSPPVAGAAGAGTASAQATPGGASCQSTTASESFADDAVLVGSATASSDTVLGASTITADSVADVSSIRLLGGEITISGVHSEAMASSNGTTGSESSAFGINSVSVLGQPASIGPDGITVSSAGAGGVLVPDANQALIALQQAGISAHTVSPTETTDAAQATVTSGGLVISFADQNIPNPSGAVPVSSVGLDLNIGFSQASADATALPPFASFGATPGSATATGAAAGGAAPSGAVAVAGPPGAAVAGGSSAPSAVASPGAAATVPAAGTGAAAPARPAPAYTPAATVLGAPIKAAWVVIAILLSLVAAGPLLGYANWQLLKGRKS